MIIPRHWACAKGETRGSGSKILTLSAWGWSEKNQSEAESHARERLRTLLAKVERGEALAHDYAYGSQPVREQVIDEVRNATNDIVGLVTRNVYGCLVLNAGEAMFLDIDVPRPSFMERVRRFFNKKKPDSETIALSRLRETLTGIRGASFRIYRTAAGFRVLATDRTFLPGDPEVERIMVSASVDPAYSRLCKIQKSFRARLTPKPWRCGRTRPPCRFPFVSSGQEQAFRQWLEEYDRAIETRATCRFVERIGWDRVHEEVAPILALHDKLTRITSELPLA